MSNAIFPPVERAWTV